MNSSAASRFARRGRRGFTLVEILVAIAILAFISGVLAQLTAMASHTSQMCQRRSNDFTKARALLDLLTLDVKAGLFRDDLACTASPGDMAFYTQRPGMNSSATRNLALVRYTIDTSAANSALDRSDLPMSWGSPASNISFGNTTSLPKLSSVTSHEAAPGVVGFQIRFLLADGTIQSVYANTPDNPLRAIGITLAVVDDTDLTSLKPATITSIVNQLSSAAAASSGSLVKTAWETALQSSFDWSGCPATLRDNIRIFERVVYVMPTF